MIKTILDATYQPWWFASALCLQKSNYHALGTDGLAGMVVLGWWLDLVISGVFSNLSDSDSRNSSLSSRVDAIKMQVFIKLSYDIAALWEIKAFPRQPQANSPAAIQPANKSVFHQLLFSIN